MIPRPKNLGRGQGGGALFGVFYEKAKLKGEGFFYSLAYGSGCQSSDNTTALPASKSPIAVKRKLISVTWCLAIR